MIRQYVLTEQEVRKVRSRLGEMRQIALMCRDAQDEESNREWYLRAKGYEEALKMLGIISTE